MEMVNILAQAFFREDKIDKVANKHTHKNHVSVKKFIYLFLFNYVLLFGSGFIIVKTFLYLLNHPFLYFRTGVAVTLDILYACLNFCDRFFLEFKPGSNHLVNSFSNCQGIFNMCDSAYKCLVPLPREKGNFTTEELMRKISLPLPVAFTSNTQGECLKPEIM